VRVCVCGVVWALALYSLLNIMRRSSPTFLRKKISLSLFEMMPDCSMEPRSIQCRHCSLKKLITVKFLQTDEV